MNILKTKLHKPPIHSTYIKRSKITTLLEDCSNYKMILVSAPAGSGKSTIINAWLDTIDTGYGWYSLDSSDNDVFQFLSYIIACLELNATYQSYQLSKLLSSFQTVGVDSLVHAIINVLYESKIPYTLILDDYHLIENQEIHNILIKILEHLPVHIQLVMITREDPPLMLSKLRVSRSLLEIRVNELQFDNTETAHFISNTIGFHVSSDHIALLNEKTEGWIAGLQLAALSLQTEKDISKLLDEFTGNHYIADYLLEEVLNHMDEDTLDFLLATSILTQFTADLCDHVLGAEVGSSQNILMDLSLNNAFIIPLDDQRQWYRYHHLFKDLLLDRLNNTSKCIRDLHYRASSWFDMHGNSDLAIDHAIKSEDYNLAANLIENIWAKCDRDMQAKRWLNMLEMLPETIIDNRPVLLMGYGWALLDTGKHLESKHWLDKSQTLYDAIQSDNLLDYHVSDQEQFDLLPSTIASAYCYLAIGEGRFDEIFDYAEKVFKQESKITSLRNSIMRMLVGLALWAIGDLAKAKHEIDQSIHYIKKSDSVISIDTYEIVSIELLVDTGQYPKACNLLDKVIANSLNDTKPPLALASFHLIYSRVHLALGNLNASVESHKISKTFGTKYCLPDYWYKYYQQQAILQIHQGLYESAYLSLDEADIHYYLNPLLIRTSLKGLRGYLLVLMDNLDEASICFDNLYGEQDIIYEGIFMSKIGKSIEANTKLESLYQLAISQNRQRSATEIALGLAVIAKEDGDSMSSIQHIKEVIGFINDHTYVEPLLRYHHILGDFYSELSFTTQVKDQLSLESNDDAFEVHQANQQLSEPLTPRELEIIQLLSNGYSNQDICDELFLALSTIKGYNQNIFGKLGVRRRTEAIAKAREFGIIS